MEFEKRNRRVKSILFGAELQKLLGLAPYLTAELADDLLIAKKRISSGTHGKVILRAMTLVNAVCGGVIKMDGNDIRVEHGNESVTVPSPWDLR